MTTHHSPWFPPASCPDPFLTGEDMEAARAAPLQVTLSIPRPTVQNINALLHLADRLNLGRSGALMFGGFYEALKHGPAPLGTYGLLRAALAHPEDARTFGFSVNRAGEGVPGSAAAE